MPAKVNAVLCESIHQEDNGKFILVGVIVGAIQTDDVEFSGSFSLFLNMFGISGGEVEVEIRLTAPDGTFDSTKMIVDVPIDASSATLQVNGLPLETKASGIFGIDWRLSDDEIWMPLLEVPVEVCSAFEADS